MKQINYKKLVLPNMPYFILGLYASKLGQTWRLTPGADFNAKFWHLAEGFTAAFQSNLPSLHPADLLVGLLCGLGLKLAVYIRSKNAKKYRQGMEYGNIFKRLYEDSVSGRISDERFMELSADYEQEQAALKARLAEIQAEQGRAREAAVNVEKFMGIIHRHMNFEELTPTLLREFVEKIMVHESVALDGKRRGKQRRQEIEIYYSFVGKVDLSDS